MNKEKSLSFHIQKTVSMVTLFGSWYFIGEDIEIINAAFGSSGYFGTISRSKCIVHNTYTARRRNFHSNPTPIHGLVHK